MADRAEEYAKLRERMAENRNKAFKEYEKCDAERVQLKKQLENVKEGMPTAKANEEIRARLADAEKALQARINEVEEKRKEVAHAVFAADQMEKANQELQKKLQKAEKAIDERNLEIIKLEKEIKALKAEADKQIKYGAKVALEEIEKHKATEKRLEEKLKENREDITRYEAELKKLQEETKAARERANRFEGRLSSGISYAESFITKNQNMPLSDIKDLRDRLKQQ